MSVLIPTDWSAYLFFFPLEWKSKLGHFEFPVLSGRSGSFMGTVYPESFMGKCWPCRDGLFSCQLVLFTKVVKRYVSILTVVVRGAACITGPLCICANKNRHAAVYSSSFTKDSTYVSEQWLQWLHLLVINHNCYAAEMHVPLTLENNPAIQRHHKSIADILDLCFSC